MRKGDATLLLFSDGVLPHLIATYGYGAVALIVGLQGLGLPLPGQAALIAAAIYAGTTHELSIELVIVAAVGDSLSFEIANRWGHRLLVSHGPPGRDFNHTMPLPHRTFGQVLV